MVYFDFDFDSDCHFFYFNLWLSQSKY